MVRVFISNCFSGRYTDDLRAIVARLGLIAATENHGRLSGLFAVRVPEPIRIPGNVLVVAAPRDALMAPILFRNPYNVLLRRSASQGLHVHPS